MNTLTTLTLDRIESEPNRYFEVILNNRKIIEVRYDERKKTFQIKRLIGKRSISADELEELFADWASIRQPSVFHGERFRKHSKTSTKYYRFFDENKYAEVCFRTPTGKEYVVVRSFEDESLYLVTYKDQEPTEQYIAWEEVLGWLIQQEEVWNSATLF